MERRVAIEEAVAGLPLMLTVEQARDVLGIGRSLAYAEVRRYLATGGRGGIPAVRIGSAIRIPRAGLVDLLLSAPGPDVCSVEQHAVAPSKPERTSRRRRSSRSTRNSSVAQLSFVEPSGS
jgi:Helix-turn-helix domain